MATFTPCVRAIKEFSTVYIRISHQSATDYIKTNYMVDKKGLKDGEIVDRYVLTECLIMIRDYVNKLNRVNTSGWSVKQVKNYLLKDGSSISFTDYADTFINNLRKEGRTGSASNYQSSLNSLKKFMEKDDFSFKDLTSKIIGKWVESMKDTERAKSMYPSHVKTIFNAGVKEYNDYDNEIILIKNNPFIANTIPAQSKKQKKDSISPALIREITRSHVNGDKAEMGRDVALMIFCLVGINTADLYRIEKHEYRGEKICYSRKKTMADRDDEAYIEVSVPEMIKPLLKKYKGKNRLFNFSEKYYSAKEFNKAVNEGLKQVSKQIGVRATTTYTYRRTWSTIAQNDCGASTELVAFCLNHVSAHRVTELYIEKDFTPIDTLNNKVIDFVFREGKKEERK